MASSSETGRSAKRKTLIPRVCVNSNGNRKVGDCTESGKDSGLSSDSTTPTCGSPLSVRPKNIVSSSTLNKSLLDVCGKNDASRINSARTSRLLRNRPGTDSPRSQDSLRTRQIASPFRPVFGANGQSPNLDSGDEGSPRLERCNYHQDIVSIKTGLLKLMRVVQEAETLNPFSNLTVNGVFQNLNDDFTTDTNIHLANGALNIADEMADLRRQVIFLQGQLDDKDRTIHHLQMQVAKQQELINNTGSQTCGLPVTSSSTKESCNAATQTEKIRPISAGPSLLQSLPGDGSMGPLVSFRIGKPCGLE